MPATSLDGAVLADIAARLSDVDERRRRRYPGDLPGRQPVHTCYVPADRVTDDLPVAWGAQALAALGQHADTPAQLADLLGLAPELAEPVYQRLHAKLAGEPVEDLRLDFEDGYRGRSEEQEDADAGRAGALLARWQAEGIAPFASGLRFSSFDTPALLARGVRTLDIVLTTAVQAHGGLPPGFVLTFPKVTAAEQVEALVELLELLEGRLGLVEGVLRFEIQVETTQSIVDTDGRIALPWFIAAGGKRLSGLHFGTYDYTAACGLPAAQQHIAHPACDFARHVMQVSAAGTGVRLSDGSTNVLPVGDGVHRGWRLHYDHVRRSLAHGFHQGWDLHPAQLVSRYAAVYAHHLSTVDSDARRLADYLAGAEGTVADEPATARMLATTLLRALDCGAITEADTGIPTATLRTLVIPHAGDR